jgi:hypothetical protein
MLPRFERGTLLASTRVLPGGPTGDGSGPDSFAGESWLKSTPNTREPDRAVGVERRSSTFNSIHHGPWSDQLMERRARDGREEIFKASNECRFVSSNYCSRRMHL